MGSGAGEDELRAEADRRFAELDSNQDGFLSAGEVAVAFERLELPATERAITTFIRSCDKNQDGLVSRAEFLRYCTGRSSELRSAFKSSDTDSTGGLTLEQFKGALEGLDVKMSREELVGAFQHLDRSKSGEVDYKEWRQALEYVPYERDTLRELFKMWHMDGDGAVHIPERTTPNPGHPRWVVFTAGAVAGAVSRTMTAPIDRVKVLQQLRGASNEKLVDKRGILKGIRDVYIEGGIRGCFRGNLVNCLKVAPQGGVQFFAFESLKKIFPQPDPDNFLASLGHRFLAGATAGVISQTAVYPLDTVKTRLAGASTGTFRGIGHCASRIYRREGARGFFRGLPACMVGAFPYAGVDLACYETIKTMYINHYQLTSQPNPLIMLGVGTVSSAIGQVATYPISLVRTRLQAQGMSKAHPVHYSGMVDCLQQIYARKGLPGFYVGLKANLAKAAPAAGISYFVYESTKQMLNPGGGDIVRAKPKTPSTQNSSG